MVRRDGRGLTVDVGDGDALAERHEKNDATSGIVIKQLEHIHSALQERNTFNEKKSITFRWKWNDIVT